MYCRANGASCRITQACTEAGPFFYVLNVEGLRKIDVGYIGQSTMSAENLEGADFSDMVKFRKLEKGEKSDG